MSDLGVHAVPKAALRHEGRGLVAEPRKITPVKWWAALGGAYAALMVYVLGKWIFVSGHFKAAPVGPDHVPGYTLVWIHTIELLSLPAMLAVAWYWGIRPWRRDGRMPTDVLIMVACMLCAFQDPLMNYSQLNFIYNGYHWNMGSWFGSLPGVLQPNGGNYPEPLLAWMPSYFWALFAPSVLGCVIARRARHRWPQLGTAGLLGLLFAFWFCFDLFIEPPLFVFTQVWSYPGVIRSLSFFAGTKYQFPIYESFGMAGLYTGMTSLRYFLDDRGRTMVERGAENVRLSHAGQTLLRGLAVTAAGASVFFFTYNLPFQWLGTHSDPFPKDMPSYMLNGICGPGTDFPCPGGPDVPIFKPSSKPPILPPPSR